MPDAATITEAPAPEAPQAGAESSSAQSTDNQQGLRPFSLGRALGDFAAEPPVQNADATTATTQGAKGADVESASPAEASKPSEAPKPEGDAAAPAEPSRRQAKAAENLARIAELEAEVASLKSATPADPEAEREAAIAAAVEQARTEERERIERERTDEQARKDAEAVSQKHLQDAERLQRLMGMPDSLISTEDYQWREEQKELLARYPEVERHYQTVAQQQIEAARAADQTSFEAERAFFWNSVAADMATATKYGLDVKAIQAADTFAKRDELVYAAGAASRDADLTKRDQRIAELEDEVKDLRLVGPRGLGAARAPVNGGRSGSTDAGPPGFDPSRDWRTNLSAALAPLSNGRN